MTTIRVSASRASELTGILRKQRSEPTTVVLEPGEYVIPLVPLVGPVTLVGEAGAGRTLVRAERDEPMVKVSRDGSVVVLRGLTLQGGEDRGGGAVEAKGEVTLLVEECILRENLAAEIMGGALLAGGDAQLTMRRCLVTGNRADGGAGGVAVRGRARAVIEDCVFSGNRAQVGAGLVVADSGHATVRRCSFMDNAVTHPRGGDDVFVTGSAVARPHLRIEDSVMASPHPIVNNLERPGELVLAGCVVPPDGLRDLRFEVEKGNRELPREQIDLAADRWATAPRGPEDP